MTDRELVESILNKCKYKDQLDSYIDNGYVKFNDHGQCTSLDLSSNKLTEIPAKLLELKHLEFLDLCDNYLTEIPEEIYKLNHLESLDLCDNYLTEIPDEMLELKHLEFLDLDNNYLTYIPKELNYIETLCTYDNPIFKSKDRVEILFNKNFKNN